jgi:hypothetical protein
MVSKLEKLRKVTLNEKSVKDIPERIKGIGLLENIFFERSVSFLAS